MIHPSYLAVINDLQQPLPYSTLPHQWLLSAPNPAPVAPSKAVIIPTLVSLRDSQDFFYRPKHQVSTVGVLGVSRAGQGWSAGSMSTRPTWKDQHIIWWSQHKTQTYHLLNFLYPSLVSSMDVLLSNTNMMLDLIHIGLFLDSNPWFLVPKRFQSLHRGSSSASSRGTSCHAENHIWMHRSWKKTRPRERKTIWLFASPK